MPYEFLQTVTKPAKESRPSISYMRFRSPKDPDNMKKRLPKLFIGIPKGMLSGFKPKQGELYEFYVGTGKDAGKARIVPGKAGISACVLKHAVAFRFGYVPMLGDEIADKEFVDGVAIDGGFELTLPAWFKPSECVAPAAPKSAAAASAKLGARK